MIEHTPLSRVGPVIASTVLAALLLLVLLAAVSLVTTRSRTVLPGARTGREPSRRFGAQPQQPTPAAVARPAPAPAATLYLVDSLSQAALAVEQQEAANLLRLQLGSPPIVDTVVVVQSPEEAEGISAAAAAASPAVAVVDLRER